MTRILGTPSRYIQGYNEIENINKYLSQYGKTALIIIDKFILDGLKPRLEKNIKDLKIFIEKFGGESSYSEIERLRKIVQKNKIEIVVGIGGGKTIDTTKAVGHFENLVVGICPSAASCDAPTSALSVIYKDNGEFEEYLFYKKNPDFVLVDSKIIAEAPPRLLVAGMGDALGTYFEARAVSKANKNNFFGAKATRSGLILAEACWNTLQESGLKAKIAVDNKVCTEDVEAIIEANTLLSGLGFESCGLACAHAFYNASTMIPELEKFYHGEKVSFGTVIELILEGAPKEELHRVLDFCISVGLPICLDDYGMKTFKDDLWLKVATKACEPSETMVNEPFDVTPVMVLNAIKCADKYAYNYKKYKLDNNLIFKY